MKSMFDRFFALILIIILFPIFIIVFSLIKIFIGSPVFFKQIRPGYQEKLFTVYKFRTMTNEVDVKGNMLPDEHRLHGLGKFIRRTSLDELPQLFNVLKGEMSFVGPRPLLVEYLPLYSSSQKKRHEVKPGITGWAQVNGRNAISWQEKFILDEWYVDNRSFWLDLKILFLTARKVLIQSDITSKTSQTMERFTGNC